MRVMYVVPIPEANMLDFLAWLKHGHPDTVLKALSDEEFTKLVIAYEEHSQGGHTPHEWLEARNVVEFIADADVGEPHVVDKLAPVGAEELAATGVKVRSGADPQSRGYDIQIRFNTVPNHAMFLYASDDVALDKYIRDNWNSLDGLSGDVCDIYPSMSQLSGDEDFFTQRKKLGNVPGIGSLSYRDLPAFHIWSSDAFVTISLKRFNTEVELRDVLREIFTLLSRDGGPLSRPLVTAIQESMSSIENGQAAASGQSMSNIRANGNINQTTILNFGYLEKELGMTSNKGGPQKQPPSGGQSIENARSGGSISQRSQEMSDAQKMRDVQANGDISQDKTQQSGLRFAWGSASGYGIIGLVIVAVAWIAYKYFISSH